MLCCCCCCCCCCHTISRLALVSTGSVVAVARPGLYTSSLLAAARGLPPASAAATSPGPVDTRAPVPSPVCSIPAPAQGGYTQDLLSLDLSMESEIDFRSCSYEISTVHCQPVPHRFICVGTGGLGLNSEAAFTQGDYNTVQMIQCL